MIGQSTTCSDGWSGTTDLTHDAGDIDWSSASGHSHLGFFSLLGCAFPVNEVVTITYVSATPDSGATGGATNYAGVSFFAGSTEVLFTGKNSLGYWGYDTGGSPVSAPIFAVSRVASPRVTTGPVLVPGLAPAPAVQKQRHGFRTDAGATPVARRRQI